MHGHPMHGPPVVFWLTPIFYREKSYFQPSTITIVRFSTLNSKTRHLAPSNYRNRAKYTPKPNPPRFSATSLVHVAPMATSATLSSLFLSQTGGPPPLLSLLSFSSHPLLSRRTPSPAPLLAPPLAGAAPRTPVAGARRRPHSPGVGKFNRNRRTEPKEPEPKPK